MRAALNQLAEQDPLIDVRQDDRQEIAVSLYGEVQKEVIQATLERDYGIAADFRDTTTVCIERPVRAGEAEQVIRAETKTNITGRSSPSSTNPFRATLALRIEPAGVGSGVEFRADVEPRLVPLYLFKTPDVFTTQMEAFVREALVEGLAGWHVTDCVVTMTECGYSVADGPPSKRGPVSMPGDYRCLTPIVVMDALDQAGTVVCEPTLRVSLEIPVWAISAVLKALGRIGAAVRRQTVRGDLTTIETVVAAARVQELQRQLPALTAGEGVLESTFHGHRPVRGDAPTRVRTTADPRRREEYLISLTRQGARS